jgi:two-component system sensor histidine kinase EvgS
MERDYIANSTVIKAAGVDGIAPLSYIDDNGEVQGIFYRVLNRISEMTGLVFECRLYQSVEEALNSDADLVYSISASYAPEHMIVSQPFLRTETILYMNYSVDPNQLDDKIYA